MSLFKKDKKGKKEDAKLVVDFDELAVPEVNVGEISESDLSDDGAGEIRYDDVAIPEIHIKKMEHKE